jgi:hypothetical protein
MKIKIGGNFSYHKSNVGSTRRDGGYKQYEHPQ